MINTSRVNTTKIDAIGLISALLVSSLIAYVLVGSGLDNASRLKVEASALSEELSYLQELSRSLEQGDLTIEMLANNMKMVEKRLPKTMEFQEFSATLTAMAQEAEVRISQLKQGQQSDRESYSEMTVAVSAVAEFESFHQFLLSLSTLERVTTLESLSIRVADEPQLCAIDMVLKIYSRRSEEAAHGA